MDRRVVAGVTIVSVLLLVAAVGLVLSPGASDEEPAPAQVELAQAEEIDETTFRITIFENGDARWAVENRQRISRDDSDAIEEFEEFADRFVEEETEIFQNFRDRAERLTTEGSEATDREMGASDFDRDARYDELNQNGVIEMSFRWEGFAQTDDDSNTVIVSDVFDGGFVILEDQDLRIQHGEGIVFAQVSPTPDRVAGEDASDPGEWVEWNGFREFEGGEIDIRLAPPGELDEAVDDDEDGDEVGEDDDGAADMMMFLFSGLVLVGIAAGVIWYTLIRSTGDGATKPETPPEPPAASTSESENIEQEQLLSDEDRVLKLLEENGGRMRQVSIVEETEWSKSKVSMLLSDMEDEGELSKLRVGRENIVSLAGEEPEAAGSPFEDDE